MSSTSSNPPQSLRIVDPGVAPDAEVLLSWLGKRQYAFWTKAADRIAQTYPGVFVPEWLYGGKKHGWSLRYKKSKPLCTFIPEKNQFQLLIVFGGKEREKVKDIRSQLAPDTVSLYDSAHTYHDGKWLLIPIKNATSLNDVGLLLTLKRKPPKP